MVFGMNTLDVDAWFPSRYGVDDEAGALIEITAASRVAAARLVRTGTVYDLAHVLHGKVPAFPGDAVLFHTGWGTLWDTDPARYPTAEPGPGLALGAWLAERRVALTGCDTWSYGPVPAEEPDEPFAVPQMLNVRHGIVVLENLRLAQLAAAGVREFMLVVSHPKRRGATGAGVAPLAIV